MSALVDRVRRRRAPRGIIDPQLVGHPQTETVLRLCRISIAAHKLTEEKRTALDDIAFRSGSERAEGSRRQNIRMMRIGKMSAPLRIDRDRHDGHDFEDWLEVERQVISQDR